MGFTDLPLEIKARIMEHLSSRQDAFTWQRICTDFRDVLQWYRDTLVKTHRTRSKLDLTHSEVCTSSLETFVAWTKAKPRKDDVIMKRSHKLFYDIYRNRGGESQDEEKARRSNARLVLRHVRLHIGDDRFMKFFETSVQDRTSWAMDVVSALSKDNEIEGDEHDDVDDENNRDHEFALCLERAALETLKSGEQRLSRNDDGRPSTQQEIREWAVEHYSDLQKSNYLAAARFAKSMLDYELTQGPDVDQMWAQRCYSAYSDILMWSAVESMDEGEFADNMLVTIVKSPDCPHVQDWADRCFSIYARFGTPVHAITFAQGMLGLPRANNSDTADPYYKWKQRCLDQERRRTHWKKAGDLAQVMLRTYLKCGNLPGSLPKSFEVSREAQHKKIASNFQKPKFRLLKMVGPAPDKTAFPEKLPRGLLKDTRAQTQILKSVTGATSDTTGPLIDGETVIEELQSAIESWKTGKSDDEIGKNQNLYYAVRFSGTRIPLLHPSDVELWWNAEE